MHAIQPDTYKATMMASMVVVLGEGQDGRTPEHKNRDKRKQKGWKTNLDNVRPTCVRPGD